MPELVLRTCAVVPEGITDETAIWAEIVACVIQAVEKAQLRPMSRIAIVGAGSTGLIAAQVVTMCSEMGVALVVNHASQASLARAYGATTIWVYRDSPTDVRDAWGQYDCVLEMSGSPEGADLAVRLTALGGRIVLFSSYDCRVGLDLTDVHRRGIELIGSNHCSSVHFETASKWLFDGRISVNALSQTGVTLAEIEKAAELVSGLGNSSLLVWPMHAGGVCTPRTASLEDEETVS